MAPPGGRLAPRVPVSRPPATYPYPGGKYFSYTDPLPGGDYYVICDFSRNDIAAELDYFTRSGPDVNALIAARLRQQVAAAALAVITARPGGRDRLIRPQRTRSKGSTRTFASQPVAGGRA